MIKTTCIVFFIALTIGGVHAQTGIEKVLSEVEKNNKSLATEKQYWEAQKLSYKTGLTPENPRIDYEHLPGSP